jgi:hypothetical protein
LNILAVREPQFRFRGAFAWGGISSAVLCLIILVTTPLQSLVAQTNPIVLENSLPGTNSTQWAIQGAGDPSIQGFATQISVNKGETVHFKINTGALAYRADIYRLGYFQGNGARLVASIQPSVPLPQSQPAPLTDTSTGLVDCGNWAESASWPVPIDATSGIYIAKLVRTDTNGSSHIVFVVRDDSGSSDVLFKTSDTTWEAYNTYGGNSLYSGAPASRAYKVSYNRPFHTVADNSYSWVFSAEYPMVRWLEANGYNVSYTTSVDADLRGSLLPGHKLFLSVGHDEYWSGGERTNVEAAVSAGTHLAFFSGNEVFWKVRWEPSIDGSATPYRTLVCYKESLANAKIDPSPFWTGTWRDPRFSPPADGGRPENKLTGTLFIVNGIVANSIQVPAAFGAHRFWRNTSVATLAAGTTAVFPAGTLGYEWDASPDNGFRPPGLMQLSSTTVVGDQVLQNYGGTVVTGGATHNLCLYRHTSGALVFGAGTVQWSWGLDSHHDNGTSPPSLPMQQATVNLLADMGIQPDTLQAGLTSATPSADFVAPTSNILTPAPGATAQVGSPLVIAGTANDTGGQVWGVEVSTDDGTNWHAASGFTNWSYTWIPVQAGPVTILSRAVDDSGNLEIPTNGVSVTVPSSQATIWPITAVPNTVDGGPDNPIELGVRFRSDLAGTIIGVRFYKSSINAGTHIGNLWTSAGALLAAATFANETPFGWQQVNFATPVSIAANTIYVASYHLTIGHESNDPQYFATAGVDNPPLHAPGSRLNGVYAYGASSTFPNQIATGYAANFWVDVAFSTNHLPILAAISNQIMAMGITLTMTNAASDPDSPPEALTFSLGPGAATNASINPGTGVFSWTPTSGQVGTNVFSVVVTDNGLPPLSATQSFSVVVVPSNAPPVLAAISNQLVAVGMTLTMTNVASDPDSPPEVLTFSLGAGTATNAVINPASGVMSWTPTSGQLGTNGFSVVVTDNALPPLSATQSFVVVVVVPSNTPPVLTAISNQLVAVGMTLTMTNVASDPDRPPQVLTFSLGAGAATNAAINPASGVFSWTPTSGQLGTNVFNMVVTDNGLPPLSATQNFAVVVVPRNMPRGRMTAKLFGTKLVVIWSEPSAILQSATNSTGLYLDVPGAASPWTNGVSGRSQLFYRLRYP